MQVPDVEVVGLHLLQAGLEVLQGAGPIRGQGLAGNVDLVADLLERRADHALVVAALVDPRRIEVVDADVGGACGRCGPAGTAAPPRFAPPRRARAARQLSRQDVGVLAQRAVDQLGGSLEAARRLQGGGFRFDRSKGRQCQTGPEKTATRR